MKQNIWADQNRNIKLALVIAESEWLATKTIDKGTMDLLTDFNLNPTAVLAAFENGLDVAEITARILP
jgi:hypothetical protein